MITTDPAPISELSDTELDSVAAGSFQFAFGNVAIAWQTNNQANLAIANFHNTQGGSQTNNNNAGNQR
jgi:hypothetical protein